MRKLVNPKGINVITFSYYSADDVVIKLKNETIAKAVDDKITQIKIGYIIIEKLVKAFGAGFRENSDFKVISPNGKQKRDVSYIQLQFFSKFKKRIDSGGLPKLCEKTNIPLYCSCCTYYNPNCKETYNKIAYMTAKTVLTAIPLPEIDNYDDNEELRARDEGESGEG